MNNMDSMQNQMMTKETMNSMMKEMQQHHFLMYTFDILVLIGLTSIIILLAKILKAHRG